jgi:hypothetical protein
VKEVKGLMLSLVVYIRKMMRRRKIMTIFLPVIKDLKFTNKTKNERISGKLIVTRMIFYVGALSSQH